MAYIRFDPDHPHPKHYRRFFIYWRAEPYVCGHCHEHVSLSDMVVHHVDGDHENVTLENLMPLHRRCHPKVHGHVGIPRGEQIRERISQSNKLTWQKLDESVKADRIARSTMPSAARHAPKHDEFGAMQREAQLTSRMRVCSCGMRTNAGSMAHHIKRTGHEIAA